MADNVERTLILLKPETTERKLVGAIISRFENKGYDIAALKLVFPSVEHIKLHYLVHKHRPFYNELVESISCKPIVAIILKGPKVVSTCRLLIGSTNPLDALPGTIRGDYATEIDRNIIHGSDSIENAETEIKLAMSVHLRSDGSASNNVFIGSDIPPPTSICRPPTNPFISSDSFRNNTLGCLPPQKTLHKHEENNISNKSSSCPSSPKKNEINSESPSFQSKPEEDSPAVNFVETSALPSAPVHLQEMVDNLLTNSVLPDYTPQLNPSSTNNPSALQRYNGINNTQDINIPDITQNLDANKNKIDSNNVTNNNVPQQQSCSPHIGDTDHKTYIQKHQPYNIGPDKYSNNPRHNRQSNAMFDIVYRQQGSINSQAQNPEQQTVDYAPPRPVYYPIPSQQQTVDYSLPPHQQQNPYYMPMPSYNSQSMLVVQLDCPHQQQRQPSTSINTNPSIITQNFHQRNNNINPVPSPQLFENGVWDDYIHVRPKNYPPHHDGNDQTFQKTPPQSTLEPSGSHFNNKQINNPRKDNHHQIHHPEIMSGRKRRRRTTPKELLILENHFKINSLPDFAQREQLARETGMTPRSVQVWFQNRRQSLKKKKVNSSTFSFNNNKSSPSSLEQPYYTTHNHHINTNESNLTQVPPCIVSSHSDNKIPLTSLDDLQDSLNRDHHHLPNLNASGHLSPISSAKTNDSSLLSHQPNYIALTTTDKNGRSPVFLLSKTITSSSGYYESKPYDDKNFINSDEPHKFTSSQNKQDDQKSIDVRSKSECVDKNFDTYIASSQNNGGNGGTSSGIQPIANYNLSPEKAYPSYSHSPSSSTPESNISPNISTSSQSKQKQQQQHSQQQKPQVTVATSIHQQQQSASSSPARPIHSFQQTNDPMATLFALAAMTSDQIDKF